MYIGNTETNPSPNRGSKVTRADNVNIAIPSSSLQKANSERASEPSVSRGGTKLSNPLYNSMLIEIGVLMEVPN